MAAVRSVHELVTVSLTGSACYSFQMDVGRNASTGQIVGSNTTLVERAVRSSPRHCIVDQTRHLSPSPSASPARPCDPAPGVRSSVRDPAGRIAPTGWQDTYSKAHARAPSIPVHGARERRPAVRQPERKTRSPGHGPGRPSLAGSPFPACLWASGARGGPAPRRLVFVVVASR